jgi:hypothetical protein
MPDRRRPASPAYPPASIAPNAANPTQAPFRNRLQGDRSCFANAGLSADSATPKTKTRDRPGKCDDQPGHDSDRKATPRIKWMTRTKRGH